MWLCFYYLASGSSFSSLLCFKCLGFIKCFNDSDNPILLVLWWSNIYGDRMLSQIIFNHSVVFVSGGYRYLMSHRFVSFVVLVWSNLRCCNWTWQCGELRVSKVCEYVDLSKITLAALLVLTFLRIIWVDIAIALVKWFINFWFLL